MYLLLRPRLCCSMSENSLSWTDVSILNSAAGFAFSQTQVNSVMQALCCVCTSVCVFICAPVFPGW